MPSPLISKIQKFSIHDGPGIRTTVFFKGCPLRCSWCHNPESLSYQSEEMMDKTGRPEQIGRFWPVPALIAELEKDLVFYEETDGGVTLSGGEPMAQDMGYISCLLRELKLKGISTAIDTCGDTPWEGFEAVLPFTDLFLYDLKLLDNEQHKVYTGASNERILSNLSRLGCAGAKICLRLPLFAGINDSMADMEGIAIWLCEEDIKPVFVNLLPYHNYGRGKYAKLGLESPESFCPPRAERLDELKAYWEHRGHKVGIGGAINQ